MNAIISDSNVKKVDASYIESIRSDEEFTKAPSVIMEITEPTHRNVGIDC